VKSEVQFSPCFARESIIKFPSRRVWVTSTDGRVFKRASISLMVELSFPSVEFGSKTHETVFRESDSRIMDGIEENRFGDEITISKALWIARSLTALESRQLAGQEKTQQKCPLELQSTPQLHSN